MNINDIYPQGARVLVDTTQVTETKFGIELANGGYNTPVTGIVVRAGEESKYKIGQTLFFRRYSVDELKYPTEEGEQVLFLVEDPDVVAIWSKLSEPSQEQNANEKDASQG